MKKILTPPGFEPQTIQPVASCYTDCAVLVAQHIYLTTFYPGDRNNNTVVEETQSFVLTVKNTVIS